MKNYQRLAKKSKLLVILIIGFSLVVGSACLAGWENQVLNANILLPTDRVFENLYYAAGENIIIQSPMKDDVYLAGSNIEISGPVEGDVIAVGSNVIISSEIKGNLRVIAKTVIIKGKIGKNVTIAGAVVTITPEAEINQSLIVAGSNVEINGKIGKNIYAAAINISINSEILGSAYLKIDPEGSLILYPQANISGNLEYTATKTAEIKGGAKIGLKEKFTQWQIEQRSPLRNRFNLIFLTWWLAGFFGALVVGLILVILFKDYTLKVQKQIDKNILLTMAKGLIYLIVAPIALIILAITIIGLPLALILGALYIILLYMVKIFVGIYIGEKAIRLFNKKLPIPLIWSMIAGLVIIYILFLLPFIGGLVKFVVVLWGLGVLLEIIKKDLKLKNI